MPLFRADGGDANRAMALLRQLTLEALHGQRPDYQLLLITSLFTSGAISSPPRVRSSSSTITSSMESCRLPQTVTAQDALSTHGSSLAPLAKTTRAPTRIAANDFCGRQKFQNSDGAQLGKVVGAAFVASFSLEFTCGLPPVLFLFYRGHTLLFP